MLNNNRYYWGIIRKVIVAFGSLFSNIYIERREGNSVTGDIRQTLKVPFSYGPKEKWLVRLEQDPTLENHTYTVLPRISFEITGYTYDSERKLGRMNQIVCKTDTGASTTLTPVPYNINMAVYILTKNQEDALQIIEQILPIFGPEYTLSINAIENMNINVNIPITLDSIDVDDQYEGDFETRRNVIHTLTFTSKTNLFGPVLEPGLIYHVDVNIGTGPTKCDPISEWRQMAKYHADGDPETHEITESWIENEF